MYTGIGCICWTRARCQPGGCWREEAHPSLVNDSWTRSRLWQPNTSILPLIANSYSLLCSILLGLADSTHDRQAHWQQPPAPRIPSSFLANNIWTQQVSQVVAFSSKAPSLTFMLMYLRRNCSSTTSDVRRATVLDCSRGEMQDTARLCLSDRKSPANPFNKLPERWAGSAAMRREEQWNKCGQIAFFSADPFLGVKQSGSWRRSKRVAHQRLLGSELAFKDARKAGNGSDRPSISLLIVNGWKQNKTSL